jgi:NADPH2:quinone reductase
MKAWTVSHYGKPIEVLKLEKTPVPSPGAGEIRVKVEALTINFNDLDGIYGRYLTVKPSLPYIPGMEVVGRVDACGEGVEEWMAKRVCAIPRGAYGGYAEETICPTRMAFEMPEHIPVVEAAAIYYPYHLSWLALFERAKLQAGETVVIHAAAGGIGSAALQLAKQVGARVIATAGSEEKLKLCKELGADVVINYREENFTDIVLKDTQWRGADVIMDSIGGEVTQQGLSCMAFGGRLLAIGFSGGIEAEDETPITARPIIFTNSSYAGVLFSYAVDPIAHRREVGVNLPAYATGEKIHAQILKLWEEKKIRSVIGQQFSFEDLPRVFEKIENRTSVGRSIILL